MAEFCYYTQPIAIFTRFLVQTSRLHGPPASYYDNTTFNYDSGDGKLLFIIVWHTVVNDPCHVNTR